MDTSLPGRHHYALARQLASLRDEGVLVIGSGNVVHNLREFDFRDPAPLDWAARADDEIRGHVAARRHEALVDYPAQPGDARLAVPTPPGRKIAHRLILGPPPNTEGDTWTRNSWSPGS
jgi:4,5-DOPA dioxygenase extradiol